MKSNTEHYNKPADKGTRNSGEAATNLVTCPVCPHHCRLSEGATGRCGARKNINDSIVCINYGKIPALALDPIEKKPLAFFEPGSFILSVGSFGCNLACHFCQNYDISTGSELEFGGLNVLTPERLCSLAEGTRSRGNIGVAFTYNEPLVGFEFVRDTAKLVHEAGMKNVLVTNGTAELAILEEILPYIDAMNIDLKGFTPEIYKKLGGDFETVKCFISRAYNDCHIELTSLIVPGLNDSPEDMEREADWIASLSPSIPLHITRYFPRYKMHEKATDISLLYKLKSVAEKRLSNVLLGNI